VGGLLLQAFWWGAVFLVSLPVMVLLLLTAPKFLPEYRDENAGRIDYASALLSLAAILCLIYGIKHTAASGLSSETAGIALLGIGLAWLFVRRQKQLSYPLMDLRLFQNPHFNAALLIYNLSGFILFGLFVHLAQYLQMVLHLSPLVAGLWTLPWALGFTVGSFFTPNLVQRFAPVRLMTVGLLLGAVGFAILIGLGNGHDLIVLVVGSTIFSLAMAPIFTLATEMIIGNAPPERAGSAAAISETCGELGGALGIALLGSLGILLYQFLMANVVPGDFPTALTHQIQHAYNDAWNALIASDDPRKARVLAQAGEAYARTLQLIAAIAAASCVLMAWLTVRFLRSSR
jgi:DHA2 family multidrug resistance protein-like MFS transporter